MGDFLDALEPAPSSQESPGCQQDHDDNLTEPSCTESTGNMFLFGADAKSRATPGIVMPMAEEASIDALEAARKRPRLRAYASLTAESGIAYTQVAPSGSSQGAGVLPMEEEKRASAKAATGRAIGEDYAGFMARTREAASLTGAKHESLQSYLQSAKHEWWSDIEARAD